MHVKVWRPVPSKSNPEDATRLPASYDGTYWYLKQIGVKGIVNKVEMNINLVLLASKFRSDTIGFQPIFCVTVFWENFRNSEPKFSGVVWIFQMGHFVYDKIIKHKNWSHHAAPVEIDIPLRRT